MKLAFNLIVCLLFCFELTIAQDDLREWIDDTGKHKTRAALVKVHEDNVELRLENGQIQMVPIVRLSKADVAYLRDLALQQENLQAPPAAKNQPEKIITNSIGMQLVLIPKGTFIMGSPVDHVGRSVDETQHEVTISQDYYLGVYEVTQAQYKKVMGKKNPSLFVGLENPVEQVSWEDAVEFCKRLSDLPKERAAGRVYRLPTESEWEYACRAGNETRYNYGDDEKQLGKHAWHRGNSDFQSHVVGMKKSNAWGLHDMHGNVWEWCADWYGEYPPNAVTDPMGPTEGSGRVYRGGGWGNDAAFCRTAGRGRGAPYFRFNAGGFRLALSPSGIPNNIFIKSPPEEESPGQLEEMNNSIGMKLVLIPQGTFMMSSSPNEGNSRPDEPQREVMISQDFYLGSCEVTQLQFRRIMRANPSHFQGEAVAERHPVTGRVVKDVNTSRHPVEQVSWDDAVEFCKRLSELPEEKAAGRVYRLPTEAEWEYACRAGAQTAYCFGDEEGELGKYAWFNGNAENRTQPVKTKRPNDWSLYDMHGNVYEWCDTGRNQGGSWARSAAECQAASAGRTWTEPRSRDIGFRVVMNLRN